MWWPLDKPFWVRLAASPDADAPSFLLQRETPDNGSTSAKGSRDGIEVAVQGKQYVRWYNAATKQTVNLLFFTDGEPPVTKADCSGAQSIVEGFTTYYGKGLRCSLSATDDLSGVDTMFLSINGKAYQPYSSAVALDTEQKVVLHYYSVDHVGYTEKPSGMQFIVDLTPPATTNIDECPPFKTVRLPLNLISQMT